MTAYAALDVSMEKTAMCVIDADGKIVLEAVTINDPEAIARCLEPHRAELELVGFEAGPLSEWLFRGLQEEGIEAVLMETRQVRAALSAMVMKTDRNDARGMAQLLRSGWFRPVHVKTIPAREQRTLLAARSTLMRRQKDIENSVRGLLKGFGLRLGRLLRGRWDDAVRDIVSGNAVLASIMEPLLVARRTLREQLAVLDKQAATSLASMLYAEGS